MKKIDKQEILRAIPPVNELLEYSEVQAHIDEIGRTGIIELINLVIQEFRKQALSDERFSSAMEGSSRKEISDYLISKLENLIEDQQEKSLKKVINATGIILHTNLGRAPLPEAAVLAAKEAGEGYCSLEFDLETGGRGSRHFHIEQIISKVTGAEAAIAVNNNAAAVFLCLNTLAAGREVIISRGQQVEIGGSFRIPDIIARSGAIMSEVGTTNKTRLSDYSNAVTPAAVALLKVHTSNYKVTGFTEEVQLSELAALGREKGIVVIEDLGSGSLYDLSRLGLPYEPTVQDSIRNGADIVTFSGDKLLGGPQAGIIAGRKELIDKIKKNPLMRMVRCDKVTIAALSAVLNLYRNIDRVVLEIPVLRMLALKEDELAASAADLENTIKEALTDRCRTEIVDELDEAGGGSLPGVVLKGKAVALELPGVDINKVQAGLRGNRVPVIGRIYKDRLHLNLRTIEKKDYPLIAEALSGILG